jgi:hypothetical protein
MRTLCKGLTLTGPGKLVVILQRRIEEASPVGAWWVVKEPVSGDTDNISETELLDEAAWCLGGAPLGWRR